MAGRHETHIAPPLRVSALTIGALIACLAGLAALQTLKFAGFVGPAWPKHLVDFDAFYIVAGMILRGELDQAYAFATLGPLQKAASGGNVFMPWTYPPPFDLVIAPLGLLPIWLAYLAFTGLTLAAFLAIARALSGEASGAALIATAPALVVTVTCGQNGFLMGSLVGLTCLGLMNRRTMAGLPLGLMAIKPHLAVGLALCTLATRRFAAATLAVGGALTLCLAATLAFGPSVWTAFLHGATEARFFLAEGLYPMYRMVSVYAVLLTLGLPAKVALAGQLLAAALAATGVVLAFRRVATQRQVLGLAVLAGLMVSPYAYDYDLPIAAIALSLLVPDLVRLTTPSERVGLLALSWISGGWGLALDIVYSDRFEIGLAQVAQPLSLGGAAFALLVLAVWRVLARDHAPSGAPAERLRPAA